MTDEAIIQKFEVEGDKQVLDAIDSITEKTKEMFELMQRQADKGGVAYDSVEKRLQALNRGFVQTVEQAKATERQLKRASDAAENFGRNIGYAVNSGRNFLSNLTRIGVGVGAAALAVSTAAGVMFNSVRKLDDATTEAQAALSAQAAANKQNAAAAIENQEAEAALTRQLVRGKITGTQYVAQLLEQREEFQRQAVVRARLQAIAEDEARQKAREQIRLKEQTAILKVQQALGVTLGNSMLALGRTVYTLQQTLLATFGPRIAGLVDILNAAIQRNQQRVMAAIDAILAALAPIAGDFASTLEAIFESVVTFATQAATAFVTVLIPAFRTFMGVVNTLATSINSIFGTNFTGQQLIVIALVLRMVGALGLLINTITVLTSGVRLLFVAFSVLAGGGGIMLLVVAAAIALALALSQINWTAVADGAVAAFKAVQTAIDTVTKWMQEAWQTALDFVYQQWQAFVQATMAGPIGSLIRGIDFLIEKLKEAYRWLQRVAGSEQQQAAPGFAGGGRVFGPGTGTSDSIWAKLSNGEFVVRARAVANLIKRYGSNFLHHLNRYGTLPNFPAPAFNMGGMVQALSPAVPRARYAAGGHVSTGSSRSSFDLVLDGRRYGGLSAPQDTVDELQRAAVTRRIASAGRAPSWVGKK